MTMFETRLSTKKWSKLDIDQMQVWLVNDKIKLDNKKQIEVHQQNRMSLIRRLTHFENDIEDIEFQYQSELFQFEHELCRASLESTHMIETLSIYLDCRIRMMIREIRYKAAIFLQKLKHPRHRSSNQRSIGIYSRLIVEQSNIDLNKNELDFLTSKGNCLVTTESPFSIEFDSRLSKLYSIKSEFSTTTKTDPKEN